MKDKEVIRALENAELPQIELQSHRSRLKMALLNRGYSTNETEVTRLETARDQKHGWLDGVGVLAHRPAWKFTATGVLAALVFATAWLSIPGISPLHKAGFFPDGTRTIGGTQLNVDDQRASDILMADPRIKDLLAQGAVIDKILPIQVRAEMIDPETGKSSFVEETWAQAWLVLGNKDWGVQIDLVKGRIDSITE